MRVENKFYVAKLGMETTFIFGYAWIGGKFENAGYGTVGATREIDIRGFSRIALDVVYTDASHTKFCFLDKEENVISEVLKYEKRDYDIEIPENAVYVGIEIGFTKEHKIGANDFHFEYICMKEVKPHYKNLKKQYSKENNQVFFRESLEGKINLFGSDFLFIKNASIEDKLAFYIYRSNKRYIVNEFNKTDCKFDYSKCSVELKLQPKDKYTKILNAYNNTYDLTKLPVAKSAVHLTKRSIIQIYLQGENTIANYANGAYWEDEVLEAIDDADKLLNKYFFAKGQSFQEINLAGFNWQINGVYKCEQKNNVWNNTSGQGSIVFTKVASAGTQGEALRLSDGKSSANTTPNIDNENPNDDVANLLYDTYRIEIYSGVNGTGQKLYESKYKYGKDVDFGIALGTRLYEMLATELGSPYLMQEPESFYLGESVVGNQVWGRLLCDTDVSTDGVVMHDLPYDDFATERANFKKCIGLNFAEGNLVKIFQSSEVQSAPTPFGQNDNGEYFIAPYMYSENFGTPLYPYPLLRSTWANTSLWIAFDNVVIQTSDKTPMLENWLKKHYKKIVHKDCMEVGAVIKALLSEIDSSIKFESTDEYSQFLYGKPNGIDNDFVQVKEYVDKLQFVDYPSRADGTTSSSGYYKGYKVDLSNYAKDYTEVYFRGADYTSSTSTNASRVCRGLILDNEGNVEAVCPFVSALSNGWQALPITEKSKTLWASYAFKEEGGEKWKPEYIVMRGERKEKIFITQKSNILKGEYDQPAQKAELTFEQLMNMLRNCFKCYWFIDSENRFRIEHIRYFMKGMSYDQPSLQYDLTKKYDKFNKKNVLHWQQEVEFDKSDLPSRYEFAWSDNTTGAMGGGFVVDVLSNYTQQDKVESINVELFTPDIDFMMFAPNKFSQDGFALLITNCTNTVRIIDKDIYNQQNDYCPMALSIQNYKASFLNLFNNYLYDMPAKQIISSVDRRDEGSRFSVGSIKRSMTHDIKVCIETEPEVYRLIKTDFGDGYVEEISVDVDSSIAEIGLSYEPK